MRNPTHITHESLGQDKTRDALEDDDLRATPTDPLVLDTLDAGTLADLAQVSGDVDGQPLVPDRNYAYQSMHCGAAATQTKPVAVTEDLTDPREPVHPDAWSPEADRALCEGAPVPDDEDENGDGDEEGYEAVEPQPYLTAGEEQANSEWAERMRHTEHAVDLHVAHSDIATTDGATTDAMTTRGPTADADDRPTDDLTREVEHAARIAALADTLECSLATARGQLAHLHSLGEDLAAGDAGTDDHAEAHPREEHSDAPDPLLGHREAYSREALRCRAPVREATDDYRAPATTVGHGERDPDAKRGVPGRFDHRDYLDSARREAITTEAERIHERYPSMSVELAERLLARELAQGTDLTDAVIAVSDPETVRAYTGITPLGALDPAGATNPREEPQATVRGEITTLYDPADRSQQQVGIIEDPTGTAKVTIWAASAANAVLREGDTVQICSAVVGEYRGQSTLAVVGEQAHLPPYKRSHEPSYLLVLERGDGPARTYTPDWVAGSTPSDDGTGDPEQPAPDPRERLTQAELGAVNAAAHRLAAVFEVSAAALGRALAERVLDGLAIEAAVRDLVGTALAAVEADGESATGAGGEVIPVPRSTPPDRRATPVEQPDKATRIELGPAALAAGEWLYADEQYPDEAWPIYRRHYDDYGDLERIERVGTLRLPDAASATHRARPATPSTAEAVDEGSVRSTTSAVCPQCNESVDASVRVMQTRSADEAGTRMYVGACGHRWRGDD